MQWQQKQENSLTSNKALFDAFIVRIECILQEPATILQSKPRVLSTSPTFTSQNTRLTPFQAPSYAASSPSY